MAFPSIFLGALIIFAVASAIMAYHWHRFSMRDRFVPLMETFYFLVALALLSLAYSSI